PKLLSQQPPSGVLPSCDRAQVKHTAPTFFQFAERATRRLRPVATPRAALPGRILPLGPGPCRGPATQLGRAPAAAVSWVMLYPALQARRAASGPARSIRTRP